MMHLAFGICHHLLEQNVCAGIYVFSLNTPMSCRELFLRLGFLTIIGVDMTFLSIKALSGDPRDIKKRKRQGPKHIEQF
jgi:hypothetical protein